MVEVCKDKAISLQIFLCRLRWGADFRGAAPFASISKDTIWLFFNAAILCSPPHAFLTAFAWISQQSTLW